MTHETHELDPVLSAFFLNSSKLYLHMNKYINKQVQKYNRRPHLEMADQSSGAALWFSTGAVDSLKFRSGSVIHQLCDLSKKHPWPGLSFLVCQIRKHVAQGAVLWIK